MYITVLMNFYTAMCHVYSIPMYTVFCCVALLFLFVDNLYMD